MSKDIISDINIFNKNSSILIIYAVTGNIISGVGPTKNPYIKYLLDISIPLRINPRRLKTIKRREEVL